MPLEWNNLRTWHGSQASAFEELCCQLAAFEEHPPGSTFVRKGTPDAGVECFWTLKTGEEKCWQAKFFTSPPSSSQWGEIDSSVRTALDKHPAICSYTICLPIDRSDARLGDTKSFLDRWNERVQKWDKWAKEKGMTVEFPYWGSFEIGERLSRIEHRGRHYFWFHEELFTNLWFQRRLEESLASVGPRYTPELNVELPISDLFDGIARSQDFFARFQERYGDVGKSLMKASSRDMGEDFHDRMTALKKQLDQLIIFTKTFDCSGITPFDWQSMKIQANESLESVEKILGFLRELEKKKEENEGKEAAKKTSPFSFGESLNHTRYSLRRIEEKIFKFREFVESKTAELANRPALLLVGDAGTGKTHLLSDMAKHHVEAGAPAILLLGSQFRDDEPWGQILRALDLSCSKEEFLGALEAAAQISGRRALLLIDAINEGEGRRIWDKHLPSILKTLAWYPWIGIAVSVRSSYEKLTIPEGVLPEKMTRAVHHGFAEHEYQAAKTFFGFYGIELPTVPILTPEFQNPLFLRCFCKGLKNRGLTKIPPGIQGITSVFNFFITSINEKLANPDHLDYDEKANLVGTAVKQIAAWLAANSIYEIPREEAQAICTRLLPGRKYEESLFRHMISEGLLNESVAYEDRVNYREIISFSYERLSDHLILQELLNKHLDPADPVTAFADGNPLSSYFCDEHACWVNRGLVEALAIQGPEVVGREIFELLPNVMNEQPVCEAFIESLLWRDPRKISEGCLLYINKHITSNQYLHHKFLNALLTVAANPDHPYNADLLHRNLIEREMSERDAWWSIFLYEGYGEKGAIDRLIDWAWSDDDKSHIADASVRLAGKALSWFLTTSHRFLRDRATKALVSLFTPRIDVLSSVIPDFLQVNDLYVLERLLAVAYGCALRSTDKAALSRLATNVYECVFKDGEPPCHILLRDYARGVVEVALRNGCNMEDVDPSKIRPPYKSVWPLEIPTKEELEKYKEWSKDMPEEQWALHTIYDSVMGHGDFARYILGSDHGNLHWSSRQLGKPRAPSRKEIHDGFISSLTERQLKAWEDFSVIRTNVDMYRRFDTELRNKTFRREFSETELDTAIYVSEMNFLKTLGKKKVQTYHEVVKPYLEAPYHEQDEFALKVSLAQRWIFKRVLDLGWTVEKFGKFDRSRDRYGNTGRAADKSERIGKKYQWIAYHEFLAHLADNLEFRDTTWKDEPSDYQGPWQLRLRDIDPSCLLTSSCRIRITRNEKAWWSPVAFDQWRTEPDDVAWRKRTDLLPDISSLPVVIDPHTGKEWLVLECNYNWEEPTPPEIEKYDVPRRDIWYMLKSYLVREEDECTFFNWAKHQHFMGRWMPESHETSKIFLGEFFWSPAFEYFDTPYYCHDGWTQGRDGQPCPILVTSDQYFNERAGYDCSIDETISFYLPAKWIADEMDLSWLGVDGCYYSNSGELAAQDPSVCTPGPRALLMNKELFMSYLAEKGYSLVWTILSEKDDIGGGMRDTDWPGRMELSGTLVLKNGRPKGLATAYFVKTESSREKIQTFEIG
jgi:hypothetical protein